MAINQLVISLNQQYAKIVKLSLNGVLTQTRFKKNEIVKIHRLVGVSN